MNFYNSDFLTQHSQSILDFYQTRCIDNDLGGYLQNYFDDGQTFDNGFKQLVSSTRMVINFCRAASLFNNDVYTQHAKHGLAYLEQHHWRQSTQTYAWTLQDNQPLDMTQQAYGYAFVLLCYAHCYRAGVISSKDKIAHTFALLESRFWQAEQGIYADTLYENGQLCDYRGQNANMHICEALIATFDATKEQKYLNRAKHLAQRFCFDLVYKENGLIYEHFTTQLQPDFEYNRHDPKNLYRSWGFQPGHQTEWAKLLLQLHHFQSDDNFLNKAQYLFTKAYKFAWDPKQGGLIYGFDKDLFPCDSDKYFWVQAESLAAAALLFDATGHANYLQQYTQLWEYCWQYFIDHTHGAWYRVLNVKNQKLSDKKSAAGAKCDYHTLGACMDILAFTKGPMIDASSK